MSTTRTLGATAATVAAALLMTSGVATAHRGPGLGPHVFDDVWVGTTGDDAYAAPDGSRDLLLGLAGDDQLDAGDRLDLVLGGPGNDAIDGGEGGDRIHGGAGHDRLAGGDGHDLIWGGPGSDGINGQAGHDHVRAGAGADTIVANDGIPDWISCGPGRDRVKADRRDRIASDCERVVRVRPHLPATPRDPTARD